MVMIKKYIILGIVIGILFCNSIFFAAFAIKKEPLTLNKEGTQRQLLLDKEVISRLLPVLNSAIPVRPAHPIASPHKK